MGRNRLLGLTARLGFGAALAGALLLAPAQALAQDDVTLTMARERFKEGVVFFDQKQFAKARVAFLQAYALKKHPAVLLNLAQSELRSNQEADAAKHFAQYLREHRQATDAERQGAETGLTAAKALVAEVSVEVDTTEAEVFVDGTLEARSPLPGPIYLAPGTHSIEARKAGKTVSTEVRASAGLSTSATLKLATPPPTVATPIQDAEAPPVDSEPESSGGRKPFFRWLVDTPTAAVGAGLAGVGLIGGVAFELGATSSYDAANNVASGITDRALGEDKKTNGAQGVCINPEDWLENYSANPTYANAGPRQERASQYVSNCNKYQDNVDAGDTFRTIAVVSFIVGGAAAAGTIIYYFVDSGETDPAGAKRRAPKLAILPMYAPGFSGALVSGSF